ncbi:hypothetical protein Heshes_11970 [Alicyclobacillus hesperidum]|uniref:Uncharacterized protein n=1 Tax=Alicyclobacillus hesperidum TaxID=89784 RepID=A0A1H2RQY5_9BACL|nr:hypothetical protein [Alicyclobacillus hesperidum]GLV13510.1 hypothetical protein Heshes_11940 [Alicyclobacillus hesperidum]GLV13513.1 hypothetical protein Heshes_11970 [Alicyclobacillus hesperidum]SDW21560.1 hypothetical protein SAMN04489725_10397 [Alicyclobacillus hesperidum]
MDRLFYVDWQTSITPMSPAQAKDVFARLIWQDSQGRHDCREKAGNANADSRVHARVNRRAGR